MSLPAFWTTAIAKALSGDQPCQLSTWIGGRTKEKRPREDTTSLALWKVNHTAQLNDHVALLRAKGWTCAVEQFWRVTGSSAVISGKADCIAQQADKRPLILDVKSGTPLESDIIQVAIEMVMIPLAWGSHDMTFQGGVVYSTHHVEVPPNKAAELKPKIFALLETAWDDAEADGEPEPRQLPFLRLPRFGMRGAVH